MRLGATPARGAAALPSPGRCCFSAPFVLVSDLLRPNCSLCLSFLQVPHFWAKCSRAENSWWHILPRLGEGGKGLATRLPPSELRRGRSVPEGVGWRTADHQQANNGEHSGPRRGRLSPAPGSRLPLCSIRPALKPRPRHVATPPQVKSRLLWTWTRPRNLRRLRPCSQLHITPPTWRLVTPILAPPIDCSGFSLAAPSPKYHPDHAHRMRGPAPRSPALCLP